MGAWFFYVVLWLISGASFNITANSPPQQLSLQTSMLGNNQNTEGEDEDEDDDDDDDEDDEDEEENGTDLQKDQIAIDLKKTENSALKPPEIQKSLLTDTKPKEEKEKKQEPKAILPPPPALVNSSSPSASVLTKSQKIANNIASSRYPLSWRSNAYASDYLHERILQINYGIM